MKTFRDLSIQDKLVLLITLTSSVVLILACAAFMADEVMAFRKDMVEDISSVTEVIAMNTTAALLFDDEASASQTLATLSVKPEVERAFVFSRSGDLFASYGSTEEEALPFFEKLDEVRQRGEIHRFHEKHLEVYRLIYLDGEIVGTICVQVGLNELSARLTQYIGIVGVVFLASVFVALILSSKLQRVISTPILDLVRASHRVSENQDYNVRVEGQNRDEIGQLISAFNEMISQIQARDVALIDAFNDQMARADELQRKNAEWERAESQLAAVVRGVGCLLWYATVKNITPTEGDQPTYDWLMQVWNENSAQEFVPLVQADDQTYAEALALSIHPEDRLEMRKISEAAFAEGVDRYRTEFRCKRIDGEYNWLAEDVRIEQVDPNEWSVVGVTTDITERKKTEEALSNSEEALRQAQKMEAIGRLAGGIAHDFNNLLTAISGFGELLLDSVQRSDPRREFVTQIMEASQRAATLTRQLLAFGRKQILQPKVVNMNEVIVGTERILERLIGEDVALLTDLDPKLGNVRVDPGQIEQVIMNLAVNARDAMPEGGTITIKTAHRVVDSAFAERHENAVPGPYVVLTVSDTGCGIDPDIGDKIFEPFFTTKEVGKGTGLGLSTVYGIVDQSNGFIDIQSELNKGTVLNIYLPEIPEKAAEEETKKASAGGVTKGSETILLVEDEARVRKLVCTGLKSNGYEVLEADSPEVALKFSEEHDGPIHLMVSDMVMPNMSGVDLAEKVAVHRPRMKVLFMSGYAEHPVFRRALQEASLEFVHKPFSMKDVSIKIRKILDDAKNGS